MLSMSYGADEHYHTPSVAGVVAFENAKQIVAGKRRLVSLYAYNKSGATVYLRVWDTSDGGTTEPAVKKATVYPVYADDFISHSIHGGDRFESGIHVQAFTEAACTNAAGNVMEYKADYTAYL